VQYDHCYHGRRLQCQVSGYMFSVGLILAYFFEASWHFHHGESEIDGYSLSKNER